MASTYTGNPTATQSPAAQPALGLFPAESLPADLDPANAASVLQAFKVVADYVAFLMKFYGVSPFESGSFADLTLNTPNTLAADAFYNNLTFTSGGSFRTAGRVLYVRDTLTFSGTGFMEVDDPAATPGATGSASAGAGGSGLNSAGSATILGGGSGGTGGAAGLAGVDGNGVLDSLGGAGGAGGTVGPTTGGNPGARTAFETGHSWIPFLHNQGAFGVRRSGTAGARTATTFGIQGGAGGGGGAGGAGQGGGGGGAGGGVGVIIARNVIFNANNNLRAPGGRGGDGGPGGASASGGGGGGGGTWLVYYGSVSGTAQLASACVPGGGAGLRGTSGGADGVVGSVGSINMIPVAF